MVHFRYISDLKPTNALVDILQKISNLSISTQKSIDMWVKKNSSLSWNFLNKFKFIWVTWFDWNWKKKNILHMQKGESDGGQNIHWWTYDCYSYCLVLINQGCDRYFNKIMTEKGKINQNKLLNFRKAENKTCVGPFDWPKVTKEDNNLLPGQLDFKSNILNILCFMQGSYI